MAMAMNVGKGRSSNSGHSINKVVVTVLKWLRRVTAAALFLLWGAFLLEHIQEWYMHPAQGFPPWWVGLSMVCHLGVLVGLLVILRWDRLGALITLLATLGFLGAIALGKGNTSNLPAIVLVNLAPVGFAVLSWLLSKRSTPAQPA